MTYCSWKKCLGPERRPADIRHVIAEDELAHARRFLPAVGDKIPAVAMVDPQDIGALLIHLGMDGGDVVGDGVAEDFQMRRGDNPLEQEKSLLLVIAAILVGDLDDAGGKCLCHE
jgi:hypothetical protein